MESCGAHRSAASDFARFFEPLRQQDAGWTGAEPLEAPFKDYINQPGIEPPLCARLGTPSPRLAPSRMTALR